MAINTTYAPVKTAFLSKINWVQAVGFGSMVFACFGIDVPPEVRAAIVTGIGASTQVVTWILRTWFTTELTTASVE